MINYIIIEDDMLSFQNVKDFIDNYMMNYDYNYKIQNYQEIIDDTGFKVYYIKIILTHLRIISLLFAIQSSY